MPFASSFLKYQLMLAFFSILTFVSISYTSHENYSLISRRSEVTHIYFLLFPPPIRVLLVPLLKLSDLLTISLKTSTVIFVFNLFVFGRQCRTIVSIMDLSHWQSIPKIYFLAGMATVNWTLCSSLCFQILHFTSSKSLKTLYLYSGYFYQKNVSYISE